MPSIALLGLIDVMVAGCVWAARHLAQQPQQQRSSSRKTTKKPTSSPTRLAVSLTSISAEFAQQPLAKARRFCPLIKAHQPIKAPMLSQVDNPHDSIGARPLGRSMDRSAGVCAKPIEIPSCAHALVLTINPLVLTLTHHQNQSPQKINKPLQERWGPHQWTWRSPRRPGRGPGTACRPRSWQRTRFGCLCWYVGVSSLSTCLCWYIGVSSLSTSAVPINAPTCTRNATHPRHSSLQVEVIVHPLVLLSTVDHYNRVAKDTRKRVVGVLLGTTYKGRIDITNSFAGAWHPRVLLG